jgi:hypothetical protein
MVWYMRLIHTNLVPDWLIRLGLRVILAGSARRRHRMSLEERDDERRALIEKLRRSPIAVHWRVAGTHASGVAGEARSPRAAGAPGPGPDVLPRRGDALAGELAPVLSGL